MQDQLSEIKTEMFGLVQATQYFAMTEKRLPILQLKYLYNKKTLSKVWHFTPLDREAGQQPRRVLRQAG